MHYAKSEHLLLLLMFLFFLYLIFSNSDTLSVNILYPKIYLCIYNFNEDVVSLLERFRALKLTPLEHFKAIYCTVEHHTSTGTIKHPKNLLSLDLKHSRIIFLALSN